jgi:hypothetical protein
MSSGGKGGGSQIVGYRYIMAVHHGLGRGPVNEFCEIRVGDLAVWGGSITESGYGQINAPQAFGGDEKEGGIVGTFKVYMGEPDQVVDDIVINNTPPPVPGWRGVTSVFYYGQIGSNNPYPKPWKFRLRRSTAGWDNADPWYPEKAVVRPPLDAAVRVNFVAQPADKNWLQINGVKAYFRTFPLSPSDVRIGSTVEESVANLAASVNFYTDVVHATAVANGNVIELRGNDGSLPTVDLPYAWANHIGSGADIHMMNPAHIIYECATNNVWGRGLPRSLIDDDSFRAAADKLYDEGFGLCMRWNRDSDIDQFVQLIVNHIGGGIFISRQTGLLTIRLLRDDYDASLLKVWTFENGLLDIVEDQASSSDTLYNEIIVEYNDPVADKIGSVRLQNLASFQSLGTLVSQTVQYHGAATASLALRLAQRDLELNSSQLRRMTLKFSRAAWTIGPTDVIKISVPSRGIDTMILRVGQVDEEPITGEVVTIKAVQDVFGLPETTIVDPQETLWVPPDRTARVVTDRLLTEMTYYDLAANIPPSQLPDFTSNTNQGFMKMYARQPSGSSIEYELQTHTAGTDYADRGIAAFDSAAVLVGDIGAYDTTFPVENGSNLSDVAAGMAVMIDDEYMRLDSVDLTAGTITVARGCVDTIPAPHLGRATVWFQTAAPASDRIDYATSEEVWARLLSRTTSQMLNPDFAEEDSIIIASRQGRPYPPGNMLVNGDPFAEGFHIIDGEIDLSWTHRDRIVEGNTLLEHQAASTGPEPGTTYTVRVYGPDQVTLLHTESGITGTTFTYTNGNAMSDGNPPVMWFWIESVRDGLASYQHYFFSVSRTIGFDAGFDYNFNGGL